MWTLKAQSGSNFDTIEIEVLATLSEGMQIVVEEGETYGGVGKSIMIKVTGAQQTVEIEIIAEDGEIIDTLSFVASNQGEIKLPWLIPKETEPGIYTFRGTDAKDSTETTFEIQ